MAGITNAKDTGGTVNIPAAAVTAAKEKKRSAVDVPSIASNLPTETALNPDFGTTDGPLVLTVYGEPTPLSRHMVSRGHMYNPSAGLQKEFANACFSSLPPTPLTGPLEAILYFYFSRPKNHYGTGKNSDVLKPLTAGNWHHKRKGMQTKKKINACVSRHLHFYCHSYGTHTSCSAFFYFAPLRVHVDPLYFCIYPQIWITWLNSF